MGTCLADIDFPVEYYSKIRLQLSPVKTLTLKGLEKNDQAIFYQ